MSGLVRAFGRNEAGRDFIVGDIHGCFDALRELLALPLVGFNEDVDRLFSVGDLVDRGPQSREAVEWLRKPWFHAVRGNHEQMAVDYVARQCDPGMYAANGGKWFLMLSPPEQEEIAAEFALLPILIEIDAGDEAVVGIVHADPVCPDWETLKAAIGNERAQTAAIWGRTRITAGDASVVDGISAVVCGHTIIERPRELGNVVYIDTGAIAGNALTMLELTPDGFKTHRVSTRRAVAA